MDQGNTYVYLYTQTPIQDDKDNSVYYSIALKLAIFAVLAIVATEVFDDLKCLYS